MDDEEWQEPGASGPSWQGLMLDAQRRIAKLEADQRAARSQVEQWVRWGDTFSNNVAVVLGIMIAIAASKYYGWDEFGLLGEYAFPMLTALGIYWCLVGIDKKPNR